MIPNTATPAVHFPPTRSLTKSTKRRRKCRALKMRPRLFGGIRKSILSQLWARFEDLFTRLKTLVWLRRNSSICRLPMFDARSYITFIIKSQVLSITLRGWYRLHWGELPRTSGAAHLTASVERSYRNGTGSLIGGRPSGSV